MAAWLLRRRCVGAAWCCVVLRGAAWCSVMLRRCCVCMVWLRDAYGLRVCCLLDVLKCIEDTLKKEKKEMQREHTN